MMVQGDEVRWGAGCCKGDYAACVRMFLPPGPNNVHWKWNTAAHLPVIPGETHLCLWHFPLDIGSGMGII